MKKIALLMLAFFTFSGVALAQQAQQPQDVFFMCEIAAGDLSSVGIDEKMTNIIFTNKNQDAWLQYVVNDAAFDENAAEEDVLAVVFDQVQPGAVQGDQVMNVLLDPNFQDAINAANIADVTAIETIYVFQGANSQQQNLAAATLLFLDDQGLLGSSVLFGNAAVACTVPAQPQGASSLN